MSRSITIYAHRDLPWHTVRGNYFAEGLTKAGILYKFSSSRTREGDGVPLLLGTTFWKAIEQDGGEYLLIDRCSFGDTEKFVSLVWNGHGRRGDHKVPEHPDPLRWEKYGVAVRPWRRTGKKIVLCGQTEPYSPDYVRMEDWYQKVALHATHFRTHPAGYNPTRLPEATDWREVRKAITLNSSVGVQAVLDGIATVTMDAGSMARDVTTHSIEVPVVMPDRIPWCHWLAWTQWTDEEIREGIPWVWHW